MKIDFFPWIARFLAYIYNQQVHFSDSTSYLVFSRMMVHLLVRLDLVEEFQDCPNQFPKFLLFESPIKSHGVPTSATVPDCQDMSFS